MLIGANAFGALVAKYTTQTPGMPDVLDWQKIWMIPALFAAVVMVGFILFFRPKAAAKAEA